MKNDTTSKGHSALLPAIMRSPAFTYAHQSLEIQDRDAKAKLIQAWTTSFLDDEHLCRMYSASALPRSSLSPAVIDKRAAGFSLMDIGLSGTPYQLAQRKMLHSRLHTESLASKTTFSRICRKEVDYFAAFIDALQAFEDLGRHILALQVLYNATGEGGNDTGFGDSAQRLITDTKDFIMQEFEPSLEKLMHIANSVRAFWSADVAKIEENHAWLSHLSHASACHLQVHGLIVLNA